MKKGSKKGRNWKVVKDIFEYHVCLFGRKKFQTQGTNKQAARNTALFGRGYT